MTDEWLTQISETNRELAAAFAIGHFLDALRSASNLTAVSIFGEVINFEQTSVLWSISLIDMAVVGGWAA
jgi:hypothetical protein